MKFTRKMQLLTVLTFMLIGSQVSAASAQVTGENNQPLLEVDTLAGSGESGEEDGAAMSASFRQPQGITIFERDSLLVSDAKNNLIRKIEDGEVSTFAGSTLIRDNVDRPDGVLFDGSSDTAMFNEPLGIAVDKEGTIFIADSKNHAIRRISAEGEVTTIAGDGVFGERDGKGEKARFYSPSDVVVDSDGTLFVADTLNHSIRKINPDGTVTTLNASSERVVEVAPGQVVESGDFVDGALDEAKFNEPSGLALDSKGNLFVADTGNHLIRYIDFKTNTVSTVAGNPNIVYANDELYAEGGFQDGEAGQAQFRFPKGITITDEGGLLVADSLNHSVRYVKGGNVTTLVGNPGAYGDHDSIEKYARLYMPHDVAVSKDGHTIWVADAYNNKIREVSLYKYPNDMVHTEEIQVRYNQNLLHFDQPPMIANNRTMIPVRSVTEALGYQVNFTMSEQGQSITLEKNDTVITLTIGQKEMQVGNGDQNDQQVKQIDVAPFIKNNRTYVPIRFFSEELGTDVQWDGENKVVILRDY